MPTARNAEYPRQASSRAHARSDGWIESRQGSGGARGGRLGRCAAVEPHVEKKSPPLNSRPPKDIPATPEKLDVRPFASDA